ncbi:MAG: 1-acyl-sn-glycerol-3-phosphate acyltransferase [Pseudomonadota bacterium]
MESFDAYLTELADHSAWRGLRRDRLIRFIESAQRRELAADEMLFQQYHPAEWFYLLFDGELQHLGAAALPGDILPFDPITRQFAPVGWSGFLPSQRYGTSVVAKRDAVLAAWRHADLAGLFYVDPELAVRFFDLVLAGVTAQLFDLRTRRLEELGQAIASHPSNSIAESVPLAGHAAATMRRSAFFSRFDDTSIDKLATAAELLSFAPDEVFCQQDQPTGGLMLLARGRCEAWFEATDKELSFYTVDREVAVVGGVPAGDSFVAEASVVARSPCFVYRLPDAALRGLALTDPEFGRAFQQRVLARLSGLLSTMRVVSDRRTTDPEAATVGSLIANKQSRLPVTSSLYRVPHLLANKLTHPNAFATLATVAATGTYEERLVANQCRRVTAALAAEHAFFYAVMETCEAVISAPESESAEQIRERCDTGVLNAFACLETVADGTDRLPREPGHVFVLNHLACPEYYELPNRYHFSFDTAFVAALLFRHYGQSALRVVRESPDAEFGHNLFYRRLGHITVPTVESGLSAISDAELAERRRQAGERFLNAAGGVLASGVNVVVCPEGQSQRIEQSPGHFHSGAFRLAQRAGVSVVPICVAGFHRRFKDGPLLAHVLPPIDCDTCAGTPRELADACRNAMAGALPDLILASERQAVLPPEGV